MVDEQEIGRIAICEYSLKRQTGTSRTVIQHARRFGALGWQPRLYVSECSAAHSAQFDCPVVRVPALRLGSAIKRSSHAWFANRLLRRWRPDIVWGHGSLVEQDVLSLHNCLHLASERLTGRISVSSRARIHDAQLGNPSSFRHLIANSELMKGDLVRRYGIASERISVVYPGYEPDVFGCDADWRAALSSRRAWLGIDNSDFVVLFATSGAFEKRGIDRFLDSMHRFVTLARGSASDARRITALLVGKADKKAVTEKIAERELGPHARFVGTVDNIEDYYKAADVLVHPAAIEEFGQVVQEAAVCGCPVITSRWVGASELMSEQGASYVLDEPDAEVIAMRLLRDYGEERDAVRQRWIDGPMTFFAHNTWEFNSYAAHRICMRVKEAKLGGASFGGVAGSVS